MCIVCPHEFRRKILAAWQTNRKTTHQPKPEDEEDSGESRNDDILQYLGGYVLQQLCKKIKISPLCDTDNSKKMYNILEAWKSENVSNQKLVNCKTKGGLWGITNPCLNIFKMARMVFVDKVNVSNFRKFDLDGTLEEVCSNENVLSNFERSGNSK